MDEQKEVSYQCPECGATWSGFDGEIPTTCPECGTEAEVVETEVGETGESEVGEAGESEAGESEVGETGEGEVLNEGEEPKDVSRTEEYNGAIGKYTITGLVDYCDEQGNIVGQFPIGSEQELPTFVGDKAVELGNATKVE